MAEQNIDKYFKEKLQNHESPVPEGLWERIEAAQEKKRRGIFWWKNPLAVASIATILAISTWLAWPDSQTSEQTDLSSTANTTSGNFKIENDNKNDIKLDNSIDKEFEVENSLDHSNSQGAIAGNNPEENRGQSNLKNGFAKDFSNQKNIEENKESFNENTFQRSTSKTLFKKSNKSGRHLQGSEYPEKDANTESNDINEGADITIESGHKKSIGQLSLIAREEKDFSQSNISKELLNSLGFRGIKDCPSALIQRRNDWFAEIYASPDYAFKTSGKGASDDYLNAKNSTETFQGAYTVGARISKNISENLMFKSGLQYSQINEKFKFRSESERKLITVVTIRTIVNSPGDTLFVRDTSIVEQIGYKVRTTFNRYRSIDIPVILGYEWGNANWKTGVQAGLIFNLRSWQQGEILDTSFNPLNFNKGSSSIFKQNIGLGLYTGFSILRNLNDRTAIFAEPYLRYNLSNMAKDKSPYNQKFTVTGINFGIRYKLNGKKPDN